jgi:hypothetical protein
MSRPKVEFLWMRDCPSWKRALSELRAAMADAGLEAGEIETIEIESQADAEREGFVGSPTVRVDGLDVEPPGPEERPALACRVYRRDDGHVSPRPDPAALRRSLTGGVRT